MREILFRGKRKDTGEWVYGVYVVMHHNDDRTHLYHFIIPENSDLSFGVKVEDILVEVIADTVGQYTGAIDKNGKEIFEGDLVKIEIGVIKYEIPDCAFIICTGGCDFVMDYAKDSEIIGNVHDNPKLLEGTEND